MKEQLNTQRSIQLSTVTMRLLSELEGVFARGDRKLCEVIRQMRIAGWLYFMTRGADYFKEDCMAEQVMDENGVSRYGIL